MPFPSFPCLVLFSEASRTEAISLPALGNFPTCEASLLLFPRQSLRPRPQPVARRGEVRVTPSDMLTSPRRNRLIRAVAVTSLVFSIYYLAWRLAFSLNTDALALSLVLWSAEAYGVLQLGLFLFTVWEPVWRRPKAAPPGLDVVVFVTTFNESLELLRK